MIKALRQLELPDLEYQKLVRKEDIVELFKENPAGEWAFKREASCEGVHVEKVNAKTGNVDELAEKMFGEQAKKGWSDWAPVSCVRSCRCVSD